MSVGLSIPALVGPYENIQAQLTQLGNALVVQNDEAAVAYLLSTDDAARVRPDAALLQVDLRAPQTVALSRGINDAGVFELSLHDERYLPFEGTGAVSTWRLDMPRAANRFDFESLTDVIVHLRYTALDGGAEFRRAVTGYDAVRTFAGRCEISLRQTFPAAWGRARAALEGQRRAQQQRVAQGGAGVPGGAGGAGGAAGEPSALSLTVNPPGTLFPRHLERIEVQAPTCTVSRPGPEGAAESAQFAHQDDGSPLGAWTITCVQADLGREIIDDIVLTVPYVGALAWDDPAGAQVARV